LCTITHRETLHIPSFARDFYAAQQGPVVVGIEATGAMRWLLQLMEELEMECRWDTSELRPATTVMIGYRQFYDLGGWPIQAFFLA